MLLWKVNYHSNYGPKHSFLKGIPFPFKPTPTFIISILACCVGLGVFPTVKARASRSNDLFSHLPTTPGKGFVFYLFYYGKGKGAG